MADDNDVIRGEPQSGAILTSDEVFQVSHDLSACCSVDVSHTVEYHDSVLEDPEETQLVVDLGPPSPDVHGVDSSV